MSFARRRNTGRRYTTRIVVRTESCESRSLLSAVNPSVDALEIASAVEGVSNLPDNQSDSESQPGNDVGVGNDSVAREVETLLSGEEEVTEVSETVVSATSEFDQWYYTNRDAILAEWSNAISGVDLNDPTVDLAQLWNDTLRNLYGAELPYDDQNVTEDGGVVTEDTVQVDETVSDASVAEEVTTSGSDAVVLSYTSLRPVFYVYNETPADGSYGGVASELIEISSAVYGEAGELISAPVLEDRLTGTQYLLPSTLTLRSDGDLTQLLEFAGVSDYRIEEQGQWVIPVNPYEGIGLLNRALSLTYYANIQSWGSGDEAAIEVSFPTDYTVEVVLPAADPSTGTDLTLSLPDTKAGMYYETVTISLDGSVTAVPPSVVEERPPVEEPVTEDAGLDVTDVSDTTVAFTSEFDQWYYTNRDAILAEWSNAISGVDLNDPTVDLAQLWNDTLRNLYGAELPYDDQNVTEDGGVVTEDTVRIDDTLIESGSEDVGTLLTEEEVADYSQPSEEIGDAVFPADDSIETITIETLSVISTSAEQFVGDESDTSSLSFRPLDMSTESMWMTEGLDIETDQVPLSVSSSETPAESEFTEGFSVGLGELDEVSVHDSADSLTLGLAPVASDSVVESGDLALLDRLFENPEFL